MVKIVSIKFKDGGKPYYFAPGDREFEKGMGVIVETAKGLEYATVAEPVTEVDESQVVSPLKPVVRIATEADLAQVKRNEERKGEAMEIARQKIEARGLEMKPVGCEFSFDGSKVTIYFTADDRVDFRELIKDLSSAFRMRIELRQIGIREEIKLMGGLATCGRECCCVRSLSEPKKVSVKMAKNQGLSLNPGKISGLCGRLMCCLAYENDYYSEACKKVPKIGSEADTPDGKGTVVNVNMLKMTVKVKIEKGDAISYHDYDIDDISFMRGNVAMGKAATPDDEEEEPVEEKEVIVEEVEPVEEPKPERERDSVRRERRNRDDKNRDDKNHGENRRENPNHGENRRENKHNEQSADKAKEGKPTDKPNQNSHGGHNRHNRGNRPQNGENAENRERAGELNAPQGGRQRKKNKHRPNHKDGAKPQNGNGANGGANGQNNA